MRLAALFIGSRTCLYLTWRRALPLVNIKYALEPCPLFRSRTKTLNGMFYVCAKGRAVFMKPSGLFLSSCSSFFITSTHINNWTRLFPLFCVCMFIYIYILHYRADNKLLRRRHSNSCWSGSVTRTMSKYPAAVYFGNMELYH